MKGMYIMLLFLIEWLEEYANTPEMYLTLSQRLRFAAALLIIGIVITVICTIVYYIGMLILERRK